VSEQLAEHEPEEALLLLGGERDQSARFADDVVLVAGLEAEQLRRLEALAHHQAAVVHQRDGHRRTLADPLQLPVHRHAPGYRLLRTREMLTSSWLAT